VRYNNLKVIEIISSAFALRVQCQMIYDDSKEREKIKRIGVVMLIIKSKDKTNQAKSRMRKTK
jgi:hypothetical protein